MEHLQTSILSICIISLIYIGYQVGKQETETKELYRKERNAFDTNQAFNKGYLLKETEIYNRFQTFNPKQDTLYTTREVSIILTGESQQ